MDNSSITTEERHTGFLEELRKILDETWSNGDKIYLHEFTNIDVKRIEEAFESFAQSGDQDYDVISGVDDLRDSLGIFGIPFPLDQDLLMEQNTLLRTKLPFICMLSNVEVKLSLRDFKRSVAAWCYNLVPIKVFEQAYDVFLRTSSSSLAQSAGSLDEKVLHAISKALGENLFEDDWRDILDHCAKKLGRKSSSNGLSKAEFIDYCVKVQENHFDTQMKRIVD